MTGTEDHNEQPQTTDLSDREALIRGAFYRAAEALERLNDPELVQAYRRYLNRLEQLLSPDEMYEYAQIIQQRTMVHQTSPLAQAEALEAATDEQVEQTVMQKVERDPEVHAAYQQYLELLKRRQLLDQQYRPV